MVSLSTFSVCRRRSPGPPLSHLLCVCVGLSVILRAFLAPSLVLLNASSAKISIINNQINNTVRQKTHANRRDTDTAPARADTRKKSQVR